MTRRRYSHKIYNLFVFYRAKVALLVIKLIAPVDMIGFVRICFVLFCFFFNIKCALILLSISSFPSHEKTKAVVLKVILESFSNR